jgi:hypothetical protein
MSKFDDIINQKKGQLNEIAGGTTNVQQVAQGQQPAQQPAQQTQQGQQPAQQPAQQTQQADPAQTLAQAFQAMKFTDPATATQIFNNAMKTVGNAPGIKEYFTSLAFDPKQGFMNTTQSSAAPQQGASTQAPGTTPLK